MYAVMNHVDHRFKYLLFLGRQPDSADQWDSLRQCQVTQHELVSG